MKIRNTVVLLMLAILGLLLLSACSKKEEQASNKAEVKEAPIAAPATPVDPATAATITGTVKYPGAAPKAVKIDMSQDTACKGGDNTVETLVVNGGNLENAFVYVKDGLGGRTFDTPKDPVTLDQKGCRYHPHVVGIMTGQTLKVINSDDTTHNIHPTPKDNREWNESQPPKAPAIEKTFAREEIMLPVKCNQHPWMKMYVNVVKSPYFAVTDKDGKYTLKGLPPGTYTIAVVQEKLGEQTQQITVAAKESKTADFAMKAAQ